jgi:hypothetical protein
MVGQFLVFLCSLAKLFALLCQFFRILVCGCFEKYHILVKSKFYIIRILKLIIILYFKIKNKINQIILIIILK